MIYHPLWRTLVLVILCVFLNACSYGTSRTPMVTHFNHSTSGMGMSYGYFKSTEKVSNYRKVDPPICTEVDCRYEHDEFFEMGGHGIISVTEDVRIKLGTEWMASIGGNAGSALWNLAVQYKTNLFYTFFGSNIIKVGYSKKLYHDIFDCGFAFVSGPYLSAKENNMGLAPGFEVLEDHSTQGFDITFGFEPFRIPFPKAKYFSLRMGGVINCNAKNLCSIAGEAGLSYTIPIISKNDEK